MDELFVNEVKKDAYDLIQKIKGCHSKSRYYQLMNDLFSLYEMCDYLCIDNIPNIDDYSFKYQDVNITNIGVSDLVANYIKNRDYYFELSKMGTKLINKYNMPRGYRYEYLLKNYLNNTDSLNLSLDFLKQFNIKIYDELLKVIVNNRALITTNIDNVDNYGTTYLLNEVKAPYLIIESQNNLTLPFTIVHEAGHIFHHSKYNKNSYKIIKANLYSSNLMEFYPNFLELVFADYLKDKNIFLDDLILIKKSFDLDVAELLEKLNNLLFIYLDKNCFDYIGYYAKLIENTLSKVVAYHFYDMYLEDSDKTLYNIDQFLTYLGCYDNVDILDKFGLNKDEILNSKVLEKHIKKY